jgi:DHA1 family bicyclomycin/chloramphenicol resistance-like MFS transporter
VISLKVFLTVFLCYCRATYKLAPTFGGYVIDYFGWHAVFLILMFIGLVVLLASHLVLLKHYQIIPSQRNPNLYYSILECSQRAQFYTHRFTGHRFQVYFTYVSLFYADIFEVEAKPMDGFLHLCR